MGSLFRRYASGLRLLRNGLSHRRGSTAVLLIVAVVACAAGSTGPAYYASAQTSIVADNFESALVIQRGVEVTQQGTATGALDLLSAKIDRSTALSVPDAAQRGRLFARPIRAVEATASLATLNNAPPLVWRTDACAHLHFSSGRCPVRPDQVVVSKSLATKTGLRTGQRVKAFGWPTFTVTGVYATPDYHLPYWFDRGGIYFPAEDPVGGPRSTADSPDAMFTPRSTIETATNNPQGTVVIDQLVDVHAVRAADLEPLVTTVTNLENDTDIGNAGGVVVSEVPSVVDTVHRSWRALAVPTFLITVQLLVLVWLLMLLVVGDAVEARGPEIALMKLRGRRGLRLLGFALGEPVAVLAIAVPMGVALGALVCALLNDALLRPGTSVQVPGLAWAGAAAATLGGVLASLVAGRRTLRRSVTDQWQHASREATRRSWVLDSIVVTAAVASLAELILGGHVTSVHSGSLGLLVPGLIGVAAAVVASRLLPAACRLLFGITRRRGGLGTFLAVRHVARRSNGVRTTIILAVAVSLATFGVLAWSTGRANRRLVADIQIGGAIARPWSTTTSPRPAPGICCSRSTRTASRGWPRGGATSRQSRCRLSPAGSARPWPPRSS